MTSEASFPQFAASPGVSASDPIRTFASRLPRLICSQNPFYLLSVCFVLHGMAQWFHSESCKAFSPWPLLGLITGYIALLAITGFVIVRFGKVWDDARSILLLILLLFVELSLIFDETLVRAPVTGRWLLLLGWAFSIGLSELLLRGLNIRLPWLFRLPYHLMLALLFVYPLLLVSTGPRLSAEAVSWRIVLFPVVAAAVLLTLLPAIRRSPNYTRDNGTPWVWPWYPWSLFVFLSVCIGFRAYALCLSFDPVLSESLSSAMKFESAFGAYFLVPMVFVAGILLLEVGLVSNRIGAIRVAMFVPAICLYLSLPGAMSSGPHRDFLRMLTSQVGSPVWLTLVAATVFYGHALLRRVAAAETMLALTLLLATRIDPLSTDLLLPRSPQLWPFIVLANVELILGLWRGDSHRVFVALTSVITSLHLWLSQFSAVPLVTREAVPVLLLTAAVLLVGAIFRDEFAWSLRVLGAPLLVLVALVGFAQIHRHAALLPVWSLPAFAITVTLIAFGYAALMHEQFYRFAGCLCAGTGSLDLSGQLVLYLIHESGWRGAPSFAVGLGWFVVAVLVSSWKAGWLTNTSHWLRRMLILEVDH